jgi:ankyrin repeat protein
MDNTEPATHAEWEKYFQSANKSNFASLIRTHPSVKLIAAVRDHNLAKVASMIARGADVNSRSMDFSDYATPLTAAVDTALKTHNYDVLEVLIAAGADLTQKPLVLETALKADDDALAAYLLRKGALPNDYINRRTCLTYAIEKGLTETTTELIAHPFAMPGYRYEDEEEIPITVPLIDKEDLNEKTPLLAAVEMENAPVITALVRAGADLNTQNGQGDTPLLYAIRLRKNAIVEYLLALGADKDFPFIGAAYEEARNHNDDAIALLDHITELENVARASDVLVHAGLPNNISTHMKKYLQGSHNLPSNANYLAKRKPLVGGAKFITPNIMYPAQTLSMHDTYTSWPGGVDPTARLFNSDNQTGGRKSRKARKVSRKSRKARKASRKSSRTARKVSRKSSRKARK